MLEYKQMAKVCDHTSVGVVVRNIKGQFALLRRARFPTGIAPIAGHIDDHGSAEQAALDEASEELGLIIASTDLKPTNIKNRRVNNRCRRQNGDHHFWTVFEVDQFMGDLTPDPYETQGAKWHTKSQLQELAERTKTYRAGQISEKEWEENPGLEEIWLDFLAELGYVK